MCVHVCIFLYVYVCLHDRTFISLPACSALVTVRCLEGGPTARTKPTPAAAAAALSCLSHQSGVCRRMCVWASDSRLKGACCMTMCESRGMEAKSNFQDIDCMWVRLWHTQLSCYSHSSTGQLTRLTATATCVLFMKALKQKKKKNNNFQVNCFVRPSYIPHLQCVKPVTEKDPTLARGGS